MISGDLDFINHMARYRRYRRTIIRAPKKKWASNISTVNATTETAGSSTQVASVRLVNNAAQGSNPTPVIVKCGNFKIQGDVYSQMSQAGTASVSLYVIYIPEGITLPDYTSALNLIRAHPEWIMAWRFINSNFVSAAGSDNSESFSFSSRLKRNLNSGDSVYLVCLASGVGLSTAYLNAMCQFWTCAN